MSAVESRKFHLSTVVVGLLLCGAAGEDTRAGTPDLHDTGSESAHDRQACTPDVMHLCRAFIPNRDAITNCLVQNIDHLSPACRTVMARNR